MSPEIVIPSRPRSSKRGASSGLSRRTTSSSRLSAESCMAISSFKPRSMSRFSRLSTVSFRIRLVFIRKCWHAQPRRRDAEGRGFTHARESAQCRPAMSSCSEPGLWASPECLLGWAVHRQVTLTYMCLDHGPNAAGWTSDTWIRPCGRYGPPGVPRRRSGRGRWIRPSNCSAHPRWPKGRRRRRRRLRAPVLPGCLRRRPLCTPRR